MRSQALIVFQIHVRVERSRGRILPAALAPVDLSGIMVFVNAVHWLDVCGMLIVVHVSNFWWDYKTKAVN